MANLPHARAARHKAKPKPPPQNLCARRKTHINSRPPPKLPAASLAGERPAENIKKRQGILTNHQYPVKYLLVMPLIAAM
ncbi:hypothetical protein B5F39_06705 [Cloacibacillus sp. An23]|nr:hypothetical protein B5F39_06705 [Cloacibacillus sp. An23]